MVAASTTATAGTKLASPRCWTQSEFWIEAEPFVGAKSSTPGESEPPKSATERNASSGALLARNSLSPVRIHSGLGVKTPRKRGKFSSCHQERVGSLWNPRLNGGESGIRTHGTFQYTRFPSVRLKPLGHLSASFHRQAGRARPRKTHGGEGGIRTLDERKPIHP